MLAQLIGGPADGKEYYVKDSVEKIVAMSGESLTVVYQDPRLADDLMTPLPRAIYTRVRKTPIFWYSHEER